MVNIPEQKDWKGLLVCQICVYSTALYVFNLIRILLGPWLLPWFKEQIMFETLVPLVGVTNNDSIFRGGK